MNIKVIIITALVGVFFSNSIFGQDISTLKYDAKYKNDSWSQNKLGVAYENGEGVPKNLKTAFSWYKKAANNGDSYGCYNLGRHYEYGLSVSVDNTKAFYWYEKAAAAHHAAACCKMGDYYFDGDIVTKDYAKAAKYFKDAAWGGNARGKYALGYCHAYGLGVKQDSIRALLWLNRAIEGNYHFAYYILANMYKYGRCVNENIKQAFSYYILGNAHDVPECMNMLAYCYAKGEGVSVDFQKAISTIERAISLYPDDPNFYDSKGEILWLRGSKNEAKEMWNMVNSIDANYYKENDTELNKYILGEK